MPRYDAHIHPISLASTPLAPTTYEYSDLPRQRCRETVPDGVRAEVDGRFLDPENVDPVEQRAGEELTARATFGLPPRFGQFLDITDCDVGWDVVRSLPGLGRRLLLVEASHGLFEPRGVTIAEVAGHRALTFTSDSIEHRSIGGRFGPVHVGDHAGDRRGSDGGLSEKRFDDLLVHLAAVGMAKGPAAAAVLRTRGDEGWARFTVCPASRFLDRIGRG